MRPVPRVGANAASAASIPLVSGPKHLRIAARRRLRGARVQCLANTGSTSGVDSVDEEVLRQVLTSRVEKSAKLLDSMIDDIVCELSTVQSVSYVYNEVPTATEEQIIRKIVKRYMSRLDQNFLASLERFQQRSRKMGHPDVALLIGKIRSEVLSQTGEQFPPEVLLLEDLMKISEKVKRIEKIKRVAEELPEQGPQTQDPESDPELQDASEVYPDLDPEAPIDDMDLKAELQRLKILREESGLRVLKEKLEQEDGVVPVVEGQPSDFEEVLDSVDEDLLDDCQPEEIQRHAYGKKITPLELELAANQFITDIEEKEEIANRSLLAKLCVIREEARLVDLEMQFTGESKGENPLKLRQNVPSQVMGIIQNLIKTGDPLKRLGLIRTTFEKDTYRPSEKDLSRAPGYVRPGMFMTALTMTQMEADSCSKQKGSAEEIPPRLLERLDDIRLEAMLVLRDMGWGEYTVDELAKRQEERADRRRQLRKDYFQKRQT